MGVYVFEVILPTGVQWVKVGWHSTQYPWLRVLGALCLIKVNGRATLPEGLRCLAIAERAALLQKHTRLLWWQPDAPKEAERVLHASLRRFQGLRAEHEWYRGDVTQAILRYARQVCIHGPNRVDKAGEVWEVSVFPVNTVRPRLDRLDHMCFDVGSNALFIAETTTCRGYRHVRQKHLRAVRATTCTSSSNTSPCSASSSPLLQ